MIYIIIVLVILLLIEDLYTILLSSRIHRLELLNINYSSKIIELETSKIIDEDKLNTFVNNFVDRVIDNNSTEMRRQNSFCINDTKELMKIAYRKAKEE